MEGNAPIIRLASGFEPRPKNGDNAIADKSPFGNIIQCSPQVGQEGTEVTIALQSSLNDVVFKIAFGNIVVETKQMSNMGVHTMIAAAPDHALTQQTGSSVPISVCAYRGDVALQTWTVGRFNYMDGNDKRRRSSSFNFGNQRDMQDNINKRNSTGSMPTVDFYNNAPYAQMMPGYGNVPYPSDQVSNLYQSYPANDGQNLQYQTYGDLLSPNNAQNITNVNMAGMSDMGAFGGNANMYQSPSLYQNPYNPMGNVAKTRSPRYAVDKINLDIKGDLYTMAQGWTQEEWSNRRRLVQFWREQSGSQITCGFQPVSQNSRLQDSIIISCIFWEQKNECYITSVDCIYLLESLIGVRFSIEEKNRIRRNLEGFRPATVSKSKMDSTEFFKLIMGFPNPKPRNIEKDVKVFKWKVLPYALKKIVAKYTSTAHSVDRRSRSPISHAHKSSDNSASGHGTPSPLMQANRSPYLMPSYGQPEQNHLSPQSIPEWSSRSPSPMHLNTGQSVSPTSMEFPGGHAYSSYPTGQPMATKPGPDELQPISPIRDHRSPMQDEYHRQMKEQMMASLTGNPSVPL